MIIALNLIQGGWLLRKHLRLTYDMKMCVHFTQKDGSGLLLLGSRNTLASNSCSSGQTPLLLASSGFEESSKCEFPCSDIGWDIEKT